jgi:hypothetical protein
MVPGFGKPFEPLIGANPLLAALLLSGVNALHSFVFSALGAELRGEGGDEAGGALGAK